MPFDRDLIPRLRELADRLVAAGSKAEHVSCSETHEIRDGLIAALDELEAKPNVLALDDLSSPLREAVKHLVGAQCRATELRRDADAAWDHGRKDDSTSMHNDARIKQTALNKILREIVTL